MWGTKKENKELSVEDKKKIKKLNKVLRLDFLISLLLGTVWFLFPNIIVYLPEEIKKKMGKEDKYIGKYIGLITMLSSFWSYKFIGKGTIFEKQFIMLIKALCGFLIIITLIIVVMNTGKFNISNFISLLLTSFWISNNTTGLFI